MDPLTRRRLLQQTLAATAGLKIVGKPSVGRAAAVPSTPTRRVSDIQNLKIVLAKSRESQAEETQAEIIIVGGGLGGVAAAIAACDAGRSVCLTEETDWLGGQATSQAVAALDDNGRVETSGATRTYQVFRKAIRDEYRRHVKLKPDVAANLHFSPGRGWGALAFEPRAAVCVIEGMLAPFLASGKLKILRRSKAIEVEMRGSRVQQVELVNLDDGRLCRTRGQVFIDATELGDLLALGAAEFVTGAEPKTETGEPRATDAADPQDVQSFTYSFVIEYCPGEHFVCPRPANYTRNRDSQPYTLTLDYGEGKLGTYGIFDARPGTFGPFWTYRRIIDAGQFDDPAYPHDLALINWPGNDYCDGNILVSDPEEQLAQLRAAQDLSLGFLHWLQTEVPRDDGGRGYPEFKLRPDVTGTAHGLSKFPYIRESRRIRALKTIVEQEITNTGQDSPRAAHFPDSVGIGHYALDLHESRRPSPVIIVPSKLFQIPLGALVPRRTENLLAGCKTIGTTHITNGCYRVHHVEWAIGEAAGLTAALCVQRGLAPREVRGQDGVLRELQRRLVRRGVPIMWYDDVTPDDPRFAEVQMSPFDQPETLKRLSRDLHAR